MSNSLKFIIVLVFGLTLFYFITYSTILQRISYDVFECEHQKHGEIKIFFKDINVGQQFEFTRNGTSSSLKILDIRGSKVIFEDREIALELDIVTNRLLQDDQKISSFFACNLVKFTM